MDPNRDITTDMARVNNDLESCVGGLHSSEERSSAWARLGSWMGTVDYRIVLCTTIAIMEYVYINVYIITSGCDGIKSLFNNIGMNETSPLPTIFINQIPHFVQNGDMS